ncbi:hypothetical protein OG563_00180 [Nocardia vinacea]|uniref:DUF222 domain-containing protein n=1 Tax=Nocardia vinacea TaxID=96468 RepID=A0ABZ1YXW4_9NOCA|nr:hypothetical protein [Nocardia vinacea]
MTTFPSRTAIAVTPLLSDIAALAELIDTEPYRARLEFRQALNGISAEDWAFLGLIHRAFAESPKTALARVVSIARARLGAPATDPGEITDGDTGLYATADAVEVPMEVELARWTRTPVRDLADDLRLHAIPTVATEAARTAPEAIARRRARHTPRPIGTVMLRHRARDERSAARRRRGEAEAEAYFADRRLLVA